MNGLSLFGGSEKRQARNEGIEAELDPAVAGMTSALRSKLTYANVVSSICLFLLLGGGAALAASRLPAGSVGTKQLRNGAVTEAKIAGAARVALRGATGPRGSEGPQGLPGVKGEAGPKGETGAKGDSGQAATNLWARLDGSGNLTHGSGVTSASHPQKGTEIVVFDQDISACAYVATAAAGATDGVSEIPTPGETAVGPLAGNSHGLVVVRATEKGAPVDFPVSVAVMC
jgi:hypothetical protein